jgi:hypothetical protein
MSDTAKMPSPSSLSTGATHELGVVLAIGANRICVLDPGDPRFCLKYERPLHERTPVGWRQTTRRRLGLWCPALSDNHSELRAYRRLRKRLGQATDGVFAACHGIVPTLRGPALRCDCVYGADGRPAPSLYRCLFGDAPDDRRYDADALCTAVDRMEAWLLHHRVPLFDLNSGNFAVVDSMAVGSMAIDNIAVDTTSVEVAIDASASHSLLVTHKKASETRHLTLVCIDLKSLVAGKEVLPISRWIPWLMRRKLKRRAERLRQRIRAAR